MRTQALIVGLVVALLPAWGAQAYPADSEHWGGHMFDGLWHGGWFGSLMMLLWLGIAIAALVLVVRRLSGSRDDGPARRDTTPLDILNERFACGEIDKDEYENAKRILTS